MKKTSDGDKKEQIRSLLSTDSSRAVADMTVMAAGDSPDAFAEIYRITVKEPYPLNMRAARALALCAVQHPSLIQPYLSTITSDVISCKTIGVKRGLMKIIIDVADINAIPDAGLLIDHCFSLIPDASQEYAMRVYAMYIISKFCDAVPELKQELGQTLDLLEEEQAPSIRAAVIKTRKKLA